MRSFKLFCTIVILLLPILTSGQTLSEFGSFLQTYYIKKDTDLVDRTIKMLNSPAASDYKRMMPLLTGFYGALFAKDTIVKNDFSGKLNQLQNSDYRKLISYLITSNIDLIYSKTALSPEYNDMNWASYFATGSTKYLDKIVANIPYAEERVDKTLFLTGYTAMWSLCSNAKNDAIIKEYLIGLQNKEKSITEIISKQPAEYREDMIGILRVQMAKGVWTGK